MFFINHNRITIMKRKKYFIIEADDAEPPQRYLSGELEFTTNRQIALRFDLLDSAKDFIQNNFSDDDCKIVALEILPSF